MYNEPDLNADRGEGEIMIMEYFERCELFELLVRVNESLGGNPSLPVNQRRLEYIPSRILWRLFLCRELPDLERAPSASLLIFILSY